MIVESERSALAIMVKSTAIGEQVVLVRHARPDIDPGRPAPTWTMAGGAREDVERLAEAILPLAPDGVLASPEAKARATGEIIADRLGHGIEVDDAFREQGGEAIPWLAGDAFRAAVIDHFARPDEVVLGDEASADSVRRFVDGVARARSRYRVPVIATHGRVLCGYLAYALGVDPVPIWSTLRLPDAVVVDLSARRMEALSW